MLKIFYLTCLLLMNLAVFSYSIDVPHNLTKKIFQYDIFQYDTLNSVVVNDSTEQILDFYEESEQWRGYPSRVHVSCNDSITGDYPLFVTAMQQKGVSSWELPLVVETRQSKVEFKDMARTLCPHDAGSNITSENRPTVHISTSHPKNISVGIQLKRVRDFYVEVNKEVSFNVTPSKPKFFYFSFDSDPWNVSRLAHAPLGLPIFNYTIPKSVILMVESDNNVCALVSIQNNSCPVFDNERDVLYQGYHLTMSTKGGITLTQAMFPKGFYIVFIVKQMDDDCTGVSGTTPLRDTDWFSSEPDEAPSSEERIKHFRLRIIGTISYTEYVVGAAVLLAITVLVAIIVLMFMAPFVRTYTVEVLSVEHMEGPSSSHLENPDDVAPIIRPDYQRETSDQSEQSGAESEREEWLPRQLTVARLNRAKPTTQSRRSDRYFWSSLTVAVVYALPVVQLLITYQQMVFQTGDQDLCYYNFLCAHPLGILSDFNHVYSNIAYVLLGLVFMMQTKYRQLRTRSKPQDVGIPHHDGLFYSMGLALVMEGLLSACYHLCPNKMNFQFDSSFMYVIAVLCMIKLYQNRHADVNASAHSTFMLLAVIMVIGLLGIMYPSLFFWVVFTILHLMTCLILTLKIYYVGRFKIGAAVFRRAVTAVRVRGRYVLVPGYRARAALLALANLANWALAAYGLYEHNKDFAKHLLAILMGNTILYTLFYIVMKVLHRERVFIYTWVYLVLAHLAWFTALYFFLDSKTKWSQTPAQSRQHNAVCEALQFYDSHDIWHLTSAAAMFLSFNILLTVDDALERTPRSEIPVF